MHTSKAVGRAVPRFPQGRGRLVFITCILLITEVFASGETFTVTNVNDFVSGSLREAIMKANAASNPPSIIAFQILPTNGIVHTITPFFPLPAISNSVIIDGYSQPLSHPNTLALGNNAVLLIELQGNTNFMDGLQILATNSVVQGLAINNFKGSGISIFGAGGNIIQGNLIAINVAGTTSKNNLFYGVSINSSPNNIIGGTLASARNVISANSRAGIQICCSESTNNLVQGNFIGTDRTGTVALGNAGAGVSLVEGTSDTLVGGISVGAGNLISGNGVGVQISYDSTPGISNFIQGNLIGTDVTGKTVLGNLSSGVQLGAPRNTVGGGTRGAGNVISGNGSEGIEIDSDQNLIQGNLIGTDISGSTALPNVSNGVFGVSGRNTIGGTATGQSNLISGNGANGVEIGSSGNVVQGNLIGTDITGLTGLPNALDGVFIEAGLNTIGGTTSGNGNIIAFNGGNGVSVSFSCECTSAVLGNSIFSNQLLGIAGARLGPRLSSANSCGGNTTISGSLNDFPATTFRVEFFSNVSCDGSGSGEGESFLGTTSVTTDARGSNDFVFTLPVSIPAGRIITATASALDAESGEYVTSGFSQCLLVIRHEYPDLVGFWPARLRQKCALTEKLQPYITLSGTLSVSNIGTARVPATFVKFFLANDRVVNTNTDILLHTTTFRALDPNRTRQVHFSGKLPPCLSASGKFVIAELDASNRVTECDKVNNAIVQSIP